MENGGFIKIHRKILDWEWFKDNNTFIVFIHLLFMANWKDGRFMGQIIPRGSLVTSLDNLALECNLSVQSVRTSLNKLKSTGEITSKSTNRFTIVTVVNYGFYQDDKSKSTNKLTNNQQTTNKQLTTIEEIKNIRSNNNIINNNIVLCDSEESQTTTTKKPKSPSRFVKPTLEEIANYCRERNNNVDSSKFYDYYEANGWRVGKNPMKDWKAAVRTWEKNSYNKSVDNSRPKTFTTTSKPNNTEGGLFTPEKIKVMEEFLNGD